MATSQTLQTVIAINAQANGFGQVGATLTELGTLVNGLSQQLINFGKESSEVYKDYEKSMREAEIALSTSHGRNTKELANAMDQLNAKATEWAATTIFHTDDVASAINQAAHAGWDLNMILNGIPVAMQLAQAGSMDLSDALTYITKTMKAFDVPYEDLGEFIDMWVYAANSSTGDVKDFGDAMKKLGATMRFTDSKEELFALIGLMHDMGETGSTAATLLRTSMMRIIAPSGVAGKVMKQLGATDEEIKTIREDASKMAALNLLGEYGFNAFDENNQAKPMIQIYAELGEVLSQIAGGYENITKNETTLGVLSTIFGTRGITGALDIVTALQNAVTLRDQLLEGKAKGYGEYASGTMMDTLFGKSEIFESKLERLKQVVGEKLSGQLESVMGSVGGIIDNIAEMDEGKFSALVSGLEVIAGAGPALLLAGGAFRIIGTLLTPAGGLGLGLVALAAAATSIQKLQEADLKSTFGDMDMDVEGITSFVQGLGSDFKEAYTYTDYFQQALEKAVENYRTASSEFGTNLFSLMIQNAELTPQDLQGLLDMGQKMYEYAEQALLTASSGDAQYWTQLFGGEDAAVNDPIYQSIIEKTNKAFEESKTELQGIGNGMREAITNAFSNDQKVDEEEYNEILGYFRAYNAAVAKAAAQAQDEEGRVKMRKWLLQAQTGSFDDINTLSRTAAAERNELTQKETDLYLDKKARLIENGGTPEELAEVDRLHNERMNEINTRWDEFQLTLWDSQLANNEQAKNWNGLKEIADRYLEGTLSSNEAIDIVRELLGTSQYSGDGFDNGGARGQLAKITGYMMTALGGEEELKHKIDLYNQKGNTKMAERLTQLYAMGMLANGFNHVLRTDPVSLFGLDLSMFGDYWTVSGNPIADKQGFEDAYTKRSTMTEYQTELQRLETLRTKSAEYEAEIATHRKWLNGEDRPFFYKGDLAAQASLEGYIASKAKIDEDIARAEARISELETLIYGAPQIPGEEPTEELDKLGAEAGEAGTEISGAAESAAGGLGSLESGLQHTAMELQTFHAPPPVAPGEREFANGGRADSPSIFGEGDTAEWAIPEQHTSRTASLLNAARAASGFTWQELLMQFGGLNAGSRSGGQTTIVYSPTINANDASGVERVLKDDKSRFEKWFRDREMRDAAEVYA